MENNKDKVFKVRDPVVKLLCLIPIKFSLVIIIIARQEHNLTVF